MVAAALVAGMVVAVPAGNLAASAATSTRGASGYWILLSSDRDGTSRGYSVRPDGSRLTPLLRQSRVLAPKVVSRDGGTVAYEDKGSRVYVSRADGSGLKAVLRNASPAALSSDGKLLAFSNYARGDGIWVVATNGRGIRRLTAGGDILPDWAPNGRSLVFSRERGNGWALVVQPLHGRPHVLARGDVYEPKWSSDGRWIAYMRLNGKDESELYVVRPDGTERHRLAFGVVFGWSPDDATLAVSNDASTITILDVHGRVRARLRTHRTGYLAVLRWSPDGRQLAVTLGYEVLVVGVDKSSVHRVLGAGTNNLLGWTRLAPVLAPARPLPPTEAIINARTLAMRARVDDLAADGDRVALLTRSRPTDCHHVAVWTPAMKSIRRFMRFGPCVDVSNRDGLWSVALAGSRAAWLQTAGGNNLEQYVETGTLASPTIVEVAAAFAFGDASYGTFVGGVAGDGALLAFTIEHVCSSYQEDEDACPPGRKDGDVTAATLYRIGGPGSCAATPLRKPSRACAPVATANGKLDVLAVDAGRIAVRTESGVRLLTSAGNVLRDFVVAADAAALSGERLAVHTADAVEVYDTHSGGLLARVPTRRNVALQDLEGDILVTAAGGTITLRKLDDGRTTTIGAGETARAQLERPGLFVAGGGRLTFTPMRELLRRLENP